MKALIGSLLVLELFIVILEIILIRLGFEDQRDESEPLRLTPVGLQANLGLNRVQGGAVPCLAK